MSSHQAQQQNIIITGGASGLGLELACRYAKRGANIALIDLRASQEAEQGVKAACSSNSQQVKLFVADMTDAQEVNQAITHIVAEHGKPDIVINCAGINTACGEFDKIEASGFERVVHVNLFGSANLARAVIPHMKGRPTKLVFIASMAGIVGNFGYSAYCASKFGVMGLANCLRLEFKPSGIQVQIICPPEVDTPMVHEEHKTIHPITMKLKLVAGTLSLKEAIDGIMKGLDSSRFIIIPGKLARLTYWLNRLLPIKLMHGIVDSIVKKEMKKL